MKDETGMRVVLFREGDYWLAQGLEHDIGVQGEHLKDVLVRLRLALEHEAWRETGPAPAYFQVLWDCRAGDYRPRDVVAGNLMLGLVA